jgi:N-methylhydantoinase B
MDAPIRVHRVALRTGSGGDGQYRGGLGQRVEYEFLTDGVTITFRGERHYTPAEGMAGGSAGAPQRAALEYDPGGDL